VFERPCDKYQRIFGTFASPNPHADASACKRAKSFPTHKRIEYICTVDKVEFIYESDIEYFQEKLLDWYQENGRTFLWRNESATNYELIISEVFLQRTKAETVSKFLSGFLKKYSSWKQLGNASELELQEVTKPLGLYKQRGSRLFKLAQELKRRRGRFPKERNQVAEIPMMGQYITNAFELYVLKKKSPLLDVNMARLLERFFGERKLVDIRHDPYLQTLAYRVVNIKKSKELNWAILDYASLVCKKQKPNCSNCLIATKCKFAHEI
jgi:A/G-specific adenine glycosylase